MANAGLDQTVANGTTVQLDGSGSIHPDGQIDSYGWSIVSDGGQTFSPECTNCERTQFVPPRSGRYEIRLRVTAASGATTVDSFYLNVTEAGPDADVYGPRTATAGKSVTFRAEAESPDATLDRISWAIDDQLLEERSLDRSVDRSEIQLSFPESASYRIQVAVFDSNGRSTYAEQYLQVDSNAALDPAVRSGSHLLPERTSDIRITFETDGFYRTPSAGAMSTDSSYIGTEVEAVGPDGGENAPWNRSPIDGLWEAASATGGAVSGHERETLECDIAGVVDSCRRAALQAERDGRTEAVRSPDQTGAFDRYGLEGVERIAGPDPSNLAGDQEATVVFVIQQGTEGALDVVTEMGRDTVGTASDSVSTLAEVAGSATSSLLPNSTDSGSVTSVDEIEKLDETSSIFSVDRSTERGGSRTTEPTPSGSETSFTGSASSTLISSTGGSSSSTSGTRSRSSGGSSSSGGSDNSVSSGTDISGAGSSTLKRSSSGGGGSLTYGRTGL